MAKIQAILLNCTLKRSPQESHTDFLFDIVRPIFDANDIGVTTLRPVDYEIAPGVQTDMTEYGAASDEWPEVAEQVLAADILVLGTPIWLGEQSSVATRVIERLYAHSAQTNARGQYVFYGKTAGCVVTGNEDGIKNVAKGVLYALNHIGYTIPPQADCGWIGEAGPGPSYGDERDGTDTPVGYDNDFTNRNTTFMTWNLIHIARMLAHAEGLPAHGNVPAAWDDGSAMAFPRPQYR